MREATDLGIGAAVRRELAGRRIDLSKIKFPVKAGIVTLQGELAFVGTNKTADETGIELKFIESSLRQIAGVKEVVFEIDNWAKSESGVWESGLPHSTSTSSSSGSTVSGDGLYCDECDMVIRFCPCCGKPLAASAKSSSRQRRSTPPVKPIIKRKIPVQPPAASTPPVIEVKPVGIPSPSVAPAKPVITPIKPAEHTPATPEAKPVTLTAKPATVPVAKPQAPVSIKPAAPQPVSAPKPVAPQPVSAPKPVAPLPTPAPAPAPKPIIAKPAIPVSKPAPDFNTKQSHSNVDSAENMNFDDLDFGLESPTEQASPVAAKPLPVAKPAASPQTAPVMAPAVPTPDFMKSDALTDDLFGSLIDNLSQSGNEESSEQSETERFGKEPTSGNVDDGGVPDLNLASLDDFTTPEPEPPIEDISDLLPPMKPVVPIRPATPRPVAEPDPFANIDDTPLPPAKPMSGGLLSFEDDDTPLPPMKPKTPAGKDPFAALFSESDLGLGGSEGGKDPFASLDLDLDVLEVFPSDDQPALPPAKPAAGTGKKPASSAPAAPVDNNPFNLDNIIDLDTPVEDKPKAGKKPAKDPFDLDDFDIGKFKL